MHSFEVRIRLFNISPRKTLGWQIAAKAALEADGGMSIYFEGLERRNPTKMVLRGKNPAKYIRVITTYARQSLLGKKCNHLHNGRIEFEYK